MPVPAPVLYPPFNILRLSHVEYTVRDLAASRAFYVDTLGLQVTHEEPGRLYLRAMEERGHHCIALVEGVEPAANVLGFKLFDEPDLDKAAEWFPAEGHPVEWVERPFQKKTFRTRDPWGIQTFVRLAPRETLMQSRCDSCFHGVKPLRIEMPLLRNQRPKIASVTYK